MLFHQVGARQRGLHLDKIQAAAPVPMALDLFAARHLLAQNSVFTPKLFPLLKRAVDFGFIAHSTIVQNRAANRRIPSGLFAN
jgi:hypothetical protein